MTYKVGPKGQVVLPKRVREQLGIAPGDEVTVEKVEEEVRIRRATPPGRLRGLLSDPTDPLPLTRQLELDHRWELAHDEMRDAEWEMMRPAASMPVEKAQARLRRMKEKRASARRAGAS